MTPDPASTLATANFWLQISTFAVVVGVILEFFDLLFFSKEMSRVQKALLFVATALVVAGCGGEYWFEQQASGAEAALQRQSDEKVAALSAAEAADNRQIAAANLKAQTATAAAAKLGVKVSDVSALVARRTADLDKTVTSLDTAQQKAEAAIAHVQAQEAPRRLTPAQEQALIVALSPYSGQKISIVTIFSEESKAFGEQLARTLRKAGWQVDESQGVFNGTMVGVGLTFPQISPTLVRMNAAGNALFQALKVEGLAPPGFTPFGQKDAAPDFIQMEIGEKPLE